MKNYISILLFTLIWILGEANCYAQYFDNVNVGLKAGVELPKLNNVYSMIYREGYKNYTWEEARKTGYYIGTFLNIKPGGSEKMSIQPEIYYSSEKTAFDYTDTANLKYQLEFNYTFIQLNTIIKYYPFGGLNIGIGPQIGLGLTKDDIVYSSNEPDPKNPDSLIQTVLRKGFKGESNFQMVFSLGYEFENGIGINAQYNLGLTDVISTQANEFGWSEKDNKLSTMQFGISYAIGLAGQGN